MKHRRRWLLLLAPLLLAGCGGLGGSSAIPTPTTSTQAPDSSGDWLVVSRGKATPSPKPTSGVPPYPFPTAGTVGTVAATTPARPTPGATCAATDVHFTHIGPLEVVPGTTTATVRWPDINGYNLVEYRLTAISQDVMLGPQRDIGWIEVVPKRDCAMLTATVKKLDRKTGYVFSLDAVVTRQSGSGTRAGTILRSGVVYTK
ncbi:hypothetical protein [Couchioplanes azureus]|uniref:hypothetical protein n=1 Tax=Couchioplanes caeruleus TaxID=56438 RepID=UPI00166FEE92|nr:hypothetical protein [Couchioplanes caeruleus]GGQ54552.1 hypothetical protein GCM10010166_24380 [Couchioplanes caeruleus subsp. azureus]